MNKKNIEIFYQLNVFSPFPLLFPATIISPFQGLFCIGLSDKNHFTRPGFIGIQKPQKARHLKAMDFNRKKNGSRKPNRRLSFQF